MTGERRGRIRLEAKAKLELAFSDSSLPATMALATAFKPQIEPRLKRIPGKWPFQDRVLVWLATKLRKEVERFHAAEGEAMDDIFPRTTRQDGRRPIQ
jgi:hypothetical protein